MDGQSFNDTFVFFTGDAYEVDGQSFNETFFFFTGDAYEVDGQSFNDTFVFFTGDAYKVDGQSFNDTLVFFSEPATFKNCNWSAFSEVSDGAVLWCLYDLPVPFAGEGVGNRIRPEGGVDVWEIRSRFFRFLLNGVCSGVGGKTIVACLLSTCDTSLLFEAPLWNWLAGGFECCLWCLGKPGNMSGSSMGAYLGVPGVHIWDP